MFSINQDRIAALVNSLSEIVLPPDFRDRLIYKINTDKETACLALLWATTVCHATKGGLLGLVNGKTIKGWDYLLYAFSATANQRPEWISLAFMKTISVQQLEELLSAFIERSKIALPDLERRAEMLRVLAQALDVHWNGSIVALLNKANHQVAGEQGFYALMATLPGFQDELKKKSSVFLFCLELSDQWFVTDQARIIPMVDYHIIRVFCRTGCVEIMDEEVRHRLQTKQPVTEEQEKRLRSLCADICLQINKQLDTPLRRELIYHLGRSYCRNHPVCIQGSEPENNSFQEMTDLKFQNICPLQAWCPGACDTNYRILWEPMIETENY